MQNERMYLYKRDAPVNDWTVVSTFIHIGKCAGTTIAKELQKRKIIHTNTVHCAQATYVEGFHDTYKYIMSVRNPIRRFISAYNWRYHSILNSGAVLEVWERQHPHYEELRLFDFYKNINGLAESIYDQNGNLDPKAYHFIQGKKEWGYRQIKEDINWYIGEFLKACPPEQIAAVVTMENLKEDMKKIFDITVTLHENENQNGYDTSLTELGTKNLRKYLAKDYECLLKLKELGLITNAYYENFGSNP